MTTVRYQAGKKYRITAKLRAKDPEFPDDPEDPNNRDGRKVGSVNKAYNSKTYGLQFQNGTATLDTDLWDKDKDENGRTPDDILGGIQSDFPDMAVEEYGNRSMLRVPDTSHMRDENGNLRTRASAARKKGAAEGDEE